ncbi:hypothetical protein KP509_02G019200 [Ceratopteris richardii]|uniref:Protein EARLY FLOWERING 4 domain-containing protein n=1 Tax=Ceratopteris richardii TaxID=49495 RepID=A0A8T2VAW8_CERRI|nr:hypothetical protein KP509_02G019200 [Ceratopteris richardii]
MERKESHSLAESGNLDARVLQTFEKKFEEVETIFHHNSALIRQISKNQEVANSDASLAINARLLRELNGNIGQVLELYADMSKEYSKALQNDQMQRKGVRKNDASPQSSKNFHSHVLSGSINSGTGSSTPK